MTGHDFVFGYRFLGGLERLLFCIKDGSTGVEWKGSKIDETVLFLGVFFFIMPSQMCFGEM